MAPGSNAALTTACANGCSEDASAAGHGEKLKLTHADGFNLAHYRVALGKGSRLVEHDLLDQAKALKHRVGTTRFQASRKSNRTCVHGECRADARYNPPRPNQVAASYRLI